MFTLHFIFRQFNGSGSGRFWVLIFLARIFFLPANAQKNPPAENKPGSELPFGKWKPIALEVASPNISNPEQYLFSDLKSMSTLWFAGKPGLIFDFRKDGTFQIDTSAGRKEMKMLGNSMPDLKKMFPVLQGSIRFADNNFPGKLLIRLDGLSEKPAQFTKGPAKAIKIMLQSRLAETNNLFEPSFQPKPGDSLQLILVLAPIEKPSPSPEKITNKIPSARIKELLPGSWKAESSFLWNPVGKGKEARAAKLPNPEIPWLLLNKNGMVYFNPSDRYEVVDGSKLRISLADSNKWESSAIKLNFSFGMEDENARKSKRTETTYVIRYLSKDSLILSAAYQPEGMLGLISELSNSDKKSGKLESITIFKREIPPATENLWQELKVSKDQDADFRPLNSSGDEILGFYEGNPMMDSPGKLAVFKNESSISGLKDSPPLGILPVYKIHKFGTAQILDAGNELYQRENPQAGWNKIPLPAPDSLFESEPKKRFAVSDARILCSTNLRMMQSTDRGKTWTPTPAMLDSICSIHSLEERQGKMILQAEKFRLSVDSSMEYVNDTIARMVPTYASQAYPVLLFSEDGGRSWQRNDSIKFSNAFITDRYMLFDRGFFLESFQNPLESSEFFFGKGLPVPRILLAMASAETGEDENALMVASLGSLLFMNSTSQIKNLIRSEKGIFYNAMEGLYFSADEGRRWKEAGNLPMRQKINAIICTSGSVYVWSGRQVWKASLQKLAEFLAD